MQYTAIFHACKNDNFQLNFSRRWSFNRCPFISFIRNILIDGANNLKKNLIGIFPVGVVFLFISFVKCI